MTVTEIKELLENPYKQKEWKVFLQTHFTNGKLYGDAQPIQLLENTISKQCLSLGNYEVDEYTKIGIFEVQLSDKVNLTRNRVALRNLIKDITKQVAGAMVVFVQGDKWRFSYISKRKVKNKETNTIEDRETAPKRYTYLFGKNEKALTAAIRFDKLIQKQQGNLYQYLTLNDFEEAFSVEKLSKEFFKQYKDTYEDFVQFLTGKRYAKKGNKYEEQVIHEPNFQLISLFNKDEKQARDFCKRMMGRIVFLYFIQKKGWLAVEQAKKWGEGNMSYLYDLFTKSKSQDNFYSSDLVRLFFETLNSPDSENPNNKLRFPYLNGGLFDDTQDKRYNKLQLPKAIFNTLFETFNNFNFTIYEDAPDEHTVAVDPEILGHIFENLLEDNKDKGAYYTPKEIVHYMCQESLKEYLLGNESLKVSGDKTGTNTITKLIGQNDLSNEEKQFAEKNAYKIIDALEQVKICDPAIGSGAFPMGLLLEIFNTQIYLQELKGFKKVNEAAIKKHIIEESIYGVDIDAGAVDIARLRFWLSLVVDEQEPQPLPNLDFKIVCANSLIPLGQIQKMDLGGTKEIADELANVRHDYFNASLEDKKTLEKKFNDLQKKLLISAKDWVSKEDAEVYQRLLDFSPFADKSCSWFDAWWMFGIKDGFDIVIGNPPYVQLQKESGKLATLYEKLGYETFERTGDIYSLFYERSVQLLSPKGLLCFITSNKWMRANYGASTRQFFVDKTYPLLLIDFGNIQVFETATVDTNILLLQNKPRAKRYDSKELFAVRFNNDFSLNDNDITEYVKKNGYVMSSLTNNAWVVGEKDIYDIKDFIEKQGRPLFEWKISINYGIKTGLNDAFIISTEIKNKIIEQDPQSKEYIKPILRGKDISAWHPDFDELWLLYIPWHFPLHEDSSIVGATPKAEPIFKEKYPAIYSHLVKFKEQLSARNQAEVGIRYEWFALQRFGSNYWRDFELPKIIYPNMTKYMPFVYDALDHFYCNDKAFFITGNNLKYLTCVFNSSIFKYCFSDNFPELQGGTRELRKVFFDKIPVKQITDAQEIPFAKIVDYLVALKRENSQEPTDQFMFMYFEQIANALVYELYFKDVFTKEGLEVANYVTQLPDIDNQSKEPVILQIRKAYIKAHEQGTPLRNAVESMTSIPQINLINNSVTS